MCPAGGSRHEAVGRSAQAMGIPRAPAPPRPRHVRPGGEAGGVPAPVGGRGAGDGHRPGPGAERGRRHRCPPPVAAAKAAVRPGPAPVRPAPAGRGRVPAGTSAGDAGRPAAVRVRVHRLERRPAGRVPAAADRHPAGGHPAPAAGAAGGVRGRPACPYPAGQAGRGGARAGPPPPGPAKKGALKPGSAYELWYADATEFDLLPHLARCWMPRGRQAKVPTPGKNRTVAAFGAVCYGKGLFVHHTRPTVSAEGMRRVVRRLLRRARGTGRKVVLVLDTGPPNHAHALHRDLEAAEPHLEAFWLPGYCWDLNLIERLWKHIKGSRVADVLFRTYRQFVRHVIDALEDFARHPDLTFPPKRRSDRKTFGKT